MYKQIEINNNCYFCFAIWLCIGRSLTMMYTVQCDFNFDGEKKTILVCCGNTVANNALWSI